MATCKPPTHELDAFEACAALSDRRRLAPSGGGKPGESGGGKPGEYDSPEYALPKVISIPFDPSASRNVLRGTITDIAEAMSHARTLPLPEKDAWLSSRVADQNILDQTDQ